MAVGHQDGPPRRGAAAHRQAHRRPTARDPAAAATSTNLPPKAAHTATGGASGRNPWPLTTACATPPTTGRASLPNAIRPAAPSIRRCAVAVTDTPAPYAPWPTACSRSPAPCSDRCCCRSGWRRRRGRPAGATQRRGHDGQVKQGEQEALHARDSVGQTSGATQRGLNPGCSERIANSRRTAIRVNGRRGPSASRAAPAVGRAPDA